MKRSKRILAIIMAIAVAVTLSVSLTASADVGRSITINAPPDLTLEGQTFRLYKVFSVSTISGENSPEDDRYAYIIDPAFSGFSDSALGIGTGAGQKSLRDYLVGLPSNPDHSLNTPSADDMIKLTDLLSQYVATNSITPVPTSPIYTGTPPTQVKFEGLDNGYYLIVGSGYSADDKSAVNPVHILATITDLLPGAVINLKADVPTIDKEIWNRHEGEWMKWDDTSIGDTVDFRIVSKVPEMPGYKVLKGGYLFTVHDEMSKGLTFNNDIEVYLGGTKADDGNGNGRKLTLGTDYNVTVGGPDADGNALIDIVFVPTVFVDYTPGDEIYIYCSAILNEDAIIEEDGNPNDVYLEYSNNPYGWGDYENKTNRTPRKRVRAYTGVLEIVKYELGKPSVLLAKAKFELYNDDGTGGLGDKISLLPIAGPVVGESGTGPNVYKVVPSGTPGAIDQFVTPENGEVRIVGLGAGFEAYRGRPTPVNDKLGIYWLVELEAPEGFFLPEEDIKVQVMIECVYDGIDDGTQLPDWYLNGYDVIDLDWQPLPGAFWVPNSGGPEFPKTGGAGRTIFFVGGVALMGLAVVGLVVISARKKRKIVID
ncbi:MAG: isopeptide-forming domain-containing fimbrial protein [Oscillospiraceae bacterium]|nr:isopeptide-forming domain-containing fimbrial protein [Oscillospiraceae bacterium]